MRYSSLPVLLVAFLLPAGASASRPEDAVAAGEVAAQAQNVPASEQDGEMHILPIYPIGLPTEADPQNEPAKDDDALTDAGGVEEVSDDAFAAAEPNERWAGALPLPLPVFDQERLQRKLAVADAVAAAAEGDPAARVPLLDYVVLVQRETCRQVYGDVTQGAGAACMAAATAGEGDEVGIDDEELTLCVDHGGVLAGRMPACTEASRQLAKLFEQEDGQPFDTLVHAFTKVARACWARTLCVE